MIYENSLGNRATLWEECVRFHGHACEDLAVGFQAAMLAAEALEMHGGESVVCVSERMTCGLDAVQVLLGCTYGGGSLHCRPRGKRAFSFYNLTNGRSCRILLKPLPIQPADEVIDFLLGERAIELFDIKPVLLEPPIRGEAGAVAACHACGEETEESFLRLRDGGWLCPDCLQLTE